MSLDAGSHLRAAVGVPREAAPGENRVALVPTVVRQLTRSGLEVIVERGAGRSAGFPDEHYATHGARLGSREDASAADIVVRVRGWGTDDVEFAWVQHPGQVVIGMAD